MKPRNPPDLTKPVDLWSDWNFERCIESSSTCVREVLVDLDLLLVESGVSVSMRGDVQLVLAEALNNVVEHAYMNRPDGEITVQVSVLPCCVGCTITDAGRPMPGLQLPKGILPTGSGAFEDVPEGGFGWFLIRQMTVDLSYSRIGAGNQLRFQMPCTP
jgi:serine/threonine-protein kinase RsbW